MEKIRYADMLPHEIVARRERFPAAFIGLGGLEWHGEHLAVGLDALKAEKLCELAAARSGGFAFPTLWYGEPRVHKLLEVNHDDDGAVKSKMGFKPEKFAESYFGKSGEQQVAFYQELLFHTLIQMNTLEMRAVCFVCGHYPLSEFAQPAVARFNAAFEDTRAFAGREVDYPYPAETVELAVDNTQRVADRKRGYPAEAPQVGGDHAAKWETSYLWYLRPDCVDMSIYLGREAEPLAGVMGVDPRKEASIEAGRKACDLIVEAMVAKAQDLMTAD